MNKNKIIFLLFPFLLANLLFSQEPTNKPFLQVRFPADGDTVSYSKIRIAGSTRPGATVTINGNNTKVYPSGAFVSRVELNLLDNAIVIFAKDSTAEDSTVIHIFRRPPIPVN